MIIVAAGDIAKNYHNKNKPIRTTKQKTRTGSDDGFGTTTRGEDEEVENDEETGPTENLMQPGTKISLNDFIRLKVIGRGSFGKVYLVRKRDTGLCYAMKILKKDQLIKKNLLIKTQGKYLSL